MTDDVLERNNGKSRRSYGTVFAVILAVLIFGVVSGIAGYYANDGNAEQPAGERFLRMIVR